MSESAFAGSPGYKPAETTLYRGVLLPTRFGDVAEEYDAARSEGVVFDRSDRGLLEIGGRDRLSWLHNLVTNAVKSLEPGRGCYAFACDVRGRVLFDLNILCLPDVLWADVDRQVLPAAIAHLDRHCITEDVALRDASGQWARLGVCGPLAARAAALLGVDAFPEMASLTSIAAEPADTRLVRSDFADLPGFELIAPRSQAAVVWRRLVHEGGLRPAGLAVLDVLRIEAGVPWLGRDIDEKVLPPETGQVQRAISYNKGCYLGQEIIERMRSHGSLARRLVRLELEDGAGLELPAELRHQDREAGRITSLVRHPVRPVWVGLGYLRTAVPVGADLSAGSPPRKVRVLGA